MDRCPFRPSAHSICHTVGAQHKLNSGCQCVLAGFDHLDHRAPCGTKWTSAASAAQVDALRVIAANPGIKAIAFGRIRESRGLTYRRLLDLGFIRVEKDRVWSGARAFVTAAGAAATLELVDIGQLTGR